jgi:S1-C subfamily serine protease
MMQENSGGRTIRLLAIGLIIGLGAYWAGSRYGQPTPAAVDATRASAIAAAAPASGGANLDATETENVRIYRQASPAVANIVTRTVEYDFFYNPVPVEGAGSGFLIDTDGHILTNYHVVQGAQTIEVTMGDLSHFKAKMIGADTRNDIALIQIDAHGHKLVPLPLGDSRNLLVGQRVLAIGNPFGFQSTLTTGVVSSLGRTVQTSESTFIDEAIQTDAAINRGNSGGPLLNSHGEVIGINSAIYAPTGTTAGIGFAIPVNTAKRVANDLITKGRVRHATLGAEGRAIWPSLAQALNLNVQQGILIERVTPGGAAAQAGIRGGNKSVLAGLQELRIGGDILVAVDGKELTSQMELNLLLNRAWPGDTVALTIVRDGKKMTIPVKLGES